MASDVAMATVSRSVQEVRVGAGDIDWMSYIGTLAAIEYSRLGRRRTTNR